MIAIINKIKKGKSIKSEVVGFVLFLLVLHGFYFNQIGVFDNVDLLKAYVQQYGIIDGFRAFVVDVDKI